LNSLETKSLKYLLLLIVYFVLTGILPLSFKLLQNVFGLESYSFWYSECCIYFAKLIFTSFLFYDCKKDDRISKAIPLLGFLQPLVGTIFYFIAIFLAKPENIES